jgi:energy-coupling factor transport system permease protein
MNEHMLQYIDNGSLIHRSDAISKLIWVFLVVFTAFQLNSSTARGAMLLILLVVTLFIARIPPGVVLRASPLIFGVAILLGLFHVFVTPGPPIYHLGPLGASREGLEDGAGFFFRLAIMVLVSFMLIWTTDIRDLMVGLAHIGLPYRFAFAIFMALRFLPMVQQEVDAVQAAHAIRGRASKSALSHRFRLWQRYLFTVIVNGLRKAESTAIAVESRGFGAYPERTYVKDFHWTSAGIGLVVVFVFISSGLIVWEHVLG